MNEHKDRKDSLDENQYLQLQFTATPFIPWEQYDYILELDGAIVLVSMREGEEDDKKTIGRFYAYLLSPNYDDDDVPSMREILEADDTTADFAELFQGDGDNLATAVQDVIHVDSIARLLMIQRMVIEPEFRGRRIGLAVVRRLIWQFDDGMGLVALDLLPWHRGIAVDSPELEAGKSKLQAYWAQLGFVRVRGTNFMVRSNQWPFPNTDKVINPQSAVPINSGAAKRRCTRKRRNR